MRKFLLILIIPLLLLSLGNAGTGESGLTYLNLPVSGKLVGSMNVLDNQTNSPLAIFSSPLGAKTETANISFSHNMWFSEVNSEAIAFGYPTEYGDIGIGMNLVQITGFEVRDRPSLEPDGKADVQYFSGNLSYTTKIINRLRVGLSLKYLFEHLYTETASGIATDLGLLWKAPADLDFSLALKNYGKMSKLDQQSTTLPKTLVIGVIRPELLNEGPLSASLGMNLKSNLVTEEIGPKIGGEISFKEKIFFRTGFEKFGDISRNSFGIGLKYKSFTLDYGLLLMDNELGNPKIITLNYRF